MRLTIPHWMASRPKNRTPDDTRETLVIVAVGVLAIVWIMLIRSAMPGRPTTRTDVTGQAESTPGKASQTPAGKRSAPENRPGQDPRPVR